MIKRELSWTLEPDRFVLNGIPGLVVFTTTRRLGMPAGPFDPASLRHLVEQLGLRPKAVIGMEQVHGDTVRVVTRSQDSVLPACDGIMTNRSCVALAVRSADCLPIVAFDPATGVLGVAHAGWRGVKAGLPVSLLEAMNASFACSDSVHVAIGPGIGRCCYEVGLDFEPWFSAYLETRSGQRFLDLSAAAVSQMEEAGLSEDRIARAPWCTACASDHCHSHRRDGRSAGRMVTIAVIL